ncbi:hypothetical protein [Flavobacterium sp. N2270]|uniref:hypothetical protein n=1 Tax=Flavobacterium sp. N2270 TaxID=2986831 RepID=UPI0022258E69|nr:hypothetical protein [Flavobacterium sp. N2270]
MKTKILLSLLLAFILPMSNYAQDKTTVRANSSDISDNLDLRAIASVFGEAKDLEDFENRINDPKTQLSNLDLNNDNYVDYLRVIESVEGDAHLIIIQSVLDKDTYQDVATIEVERDNKNNVQVQVVGNVYMYGENYIYEPVYVNRPIIYNVFWVRNYRPYSSIWYWNYYPSYYYNWNPFPIFRYRNHISLHINFGHTYHYVNYRSCHRAYGMYSTRRSYAYETRHPNRSFSHRNNGYSNRHELDNNRPIRNVRPRSEMASNEPRNSSPRANTSTPRTNTPRGNVEPRTSSPRNSSPRETTSPRGTNSPRGTTSQINSTPRGNVEPRSNSPKATSSPRTNNSNGYNAPRSQSQPKSVSNPRSTSQPRATSPRSSNTKNSTRSSSSSSNRNSSGTRSSSSRSNGRNN